MKCYLDASGSTLVDCVAGVHVWPRFAVAAYSGAERGGNPSGTGVVDFEYFFAAGSSRYQAHTALCDSQSLRYELDQGVVGGVFDRRCCNTNLDRATVHAGKLSFCRTRLYIDFKSDGRHLAGILPPYAMPVTLAR